MSIENSVNMPSVATQATSSVSQVQATPSVTEQKGAGAEPVPAAAEQELSIEKLQEAVDKMNALMQNGQRSLNFSIDDSTERVVVKVMDVQTDEVIRQIPTEETLKLAEYIEGMVGLIFDKRA